MAIVVPGKAALTQIDQSNFLPMSAAMQRSDAVPSHRELL
jgi:hypothetical protein